MLAAIKEKVRNHNLVKIALSDPASSAIFQIALPVLSFLIYYLTLSPGVFGFDSAELATGVFTWGIIHPPGYPLYLILGKIFSFLPFGDLAYRLNLMSAFFAALTTLVNYRILKLLAINNLVAAAGACIFAFSNYYWQMSVVAEVYTLHVFLLSLSLYVILLWRKKGNDKNLLSFSFLFGLSFSSHTSSILFFPGFFWLIVTCKHWNWRKWKIYLPVSVFFIIGLLPYLYLPLRALANPALNYSNYYNVDLTSWAGFWWMISGKAYHFFAFSYPLDKVPTELYIFIRFLFRNYLGVGFIVGLIGLYLYVRKNTQEAFGLLLIFLGNVIFYLNYQVADKDTMFLPAFFIWSIFIAYGISRILPWIISLVDESALAKYVRSALYSFLLFIILFTVLINWQWVDLSNSSGPRIFAEEVLNNVEPNSIILAKWSPAVVLEYYQIVQNMRPDIDIINRSRIEVAEYYHLNELGMTPEYINAQIDQNEIDFLEQSIQDRTVYIIEYESLLSKHFKYIPVRNFFKLEPR